MMSKKNPLERFIPRYEEATKEDFELLAAEVAELRATVKSTNDGLYLDKVSLINTDVLMQADLQFRTFVATSSDLVYRMSADWTKMRVLSGKELSTTNEPSDSNWLERYIPIQEQARVLEALGKAAIDKQMFEMEHQVKHGNGKTSWRLSRAIPILDSKGEIIEWLGTASDVTARKLAEQQLEDFTRRLEEQVNERTAALKESHDQLQSIFDSTLMQMSILRAVRDDQSEIVDFDILLVNEQLEKETRRSDLIGKRYAQEYPGIRQAGLFDLIVKAIETGEPQQLEYPYSHEGVSKWYSSMFVKLNDGVVSVNMDISARKITEQELYKNYILLQQSEEIAAIGSWEFDIITGVFSCSEGMYKLFGLTKDVAVSPEIYLEHSSPSGLPTAQRVVDHIRSGDAEFSETLEILIHGQLKILQLEATVIRNDNDRMVKVLGIDMDVTASRIAANKIKKLEAEKQQEVFLTTMSTQEEERRRLSESLHNGLAQTLYAIKMSIALLTADLAISNPASYAQAKIYTEELLTSAIAESRTISHQLMPSVLEDFGLKAAIADVCQHLNGQVQFSFFFDIAKARVNKYLELAIFRIVQELMLNVIKHSNATRAGVKLSIDSKEVFIRVEDNGR
jgi:signal transduction histidine kinase